MKWAVVLTTCKVNAVRNMAFEKIEKKLMLKGINLAVLDDQELAIVAAEFTGEVPPDHLPRETIIEILSQQEGVRKWALSVKERIGSNATKAVTGQIRDRAQAVQAKANSRIENDPIAARMTEKFGVWLKESGFTSTQLTKMLDSNADGFVSSEEATNLIRELSNVEPPEWVIDHVLKVMDSNGDGQLSVPEWWEFLESIGFQMNISPEDDEFADLEQELLTEQKAEVEHTEATAESEQDMVEALAEAEKRAAEREAEAEKVAEAAKVAEAEKVAESLNIEPQKLEDDLSPDEENTSSLIDVTSNQDVAQEVSSAIENPTVLEIKHLENSRLSSEAAAIIEQCNEYTCVIKVEEVNRTLLALDQYRGGCSIQGEINGEPVSAEIMFTASENELVESFKRGSLITCQAKIVKWSSGSRQATLAGQNPVMK